MWRDVQHLFVAQADSYEKFVNSLKFRDLQSSEIFTYESTSQDASKHLIKECKAVAALVMHQHDNERSIQPLIHNILFDASETACSRTGREFFTISEPIIVTGSGIDQMRAL